MITNAIEQVKEFADTFNIEYSDNMNANIDESIIDLRFRLMQEENLEYLEAAKNKDIVEIADALGDILYILCGTILTHGLQHKIVEVFDEIGRSVMYVTSGQHKYYEPTFDTDGIRDLHLQPAPSGIYQSHRDKDKKSERWRQMFIDMKKCIGFISAKLNIQIHYYEDIFGDKQYRKKEFGQKGLRYNEDWFNPNRRLRDGKQWWSNHQKKMVKQT